jgi:hypothetical protein
MKLWNLLYDVVHALFRIDLTQADIGGDQAGDIGSVDGRKSVIGLKGCRQKSRDLGPHGRIRS